MDKEKVNVIKANKKVLTMSDPKICKYCEHYNKYLICTNKGSRYHGAPMMPHFFAKAI